MFTLSPNLWQIPIGTFAVYAVLVVALRLFGKRELGQMTPFDLVLILTLSNSVQNAMTGGDNSLAGGVLSALTLLVAHWAFTRLGDRVPGVKTWLEGEPTLLVHEGKLIPRHMRLEGVELDEIMMAVRQHGLNDLSEVGDAVLEVDGTISVIPADKEPSKQRRPRRVHR